jgi:ribulose-5-phosphate 4-epimerase/fuculose-1-phosphate aldolase
VHATSLTLKLICPKEAILNYNVEDLFYFFGKTAERLCSIEAAAGTSGNISVRADAFPVEDFPREGSREAAFQKLGREYPELLRNRFVITGSGKNLRFMRERPHECLALIEMVEGGYNVLWGLEEGELITSEHPAHFKTYEYRPGVSAFVHAQPISINVLTRLFRSEDSLNRLLFAQHEQLKICCPKGTGLVDALSHGSDELAQAVASSLTEKNICAVVRHGTFSVGEKDPISALNSACDLQEYYHDAARTFLDNPWLRLLPVDFLLKNLGRISRLPLGEKVVGAFLRPPK